MVSACGIVCEYNPFHNGHLYQIDYVKTQYSLPIVCAMSGNFVERAEPALFDKRERADIAVNNGADVVLEIPFPYSSMGAEQFARAGVRILSSCGMCSHIAFGSECGDVALLTTIADFLLTADFEKAVRTYQKEHGNASFAVARECVVADVLGKTYADVLSHPNDILAVEYLKAIRTAHSHLIPIAVKRQTADDGRYMSSSMLRKAYLSGEIDTVKTYVPSIPTNGQGLRNENFNRLLHTSLMVKSPDDLKGIAEIAGGSEHLLVKKAKENSSYTSLCASLKCKSFTDAKIRRMLLFAFFGVTKAMQNTDVAYTRVLAVKEGETAKELLRTSRKHKTMPVCQTPSSARKQKDSAVQYHFSENAEAVLYACVPAER